MKAFIDVDGAPVFGIPVTDGLGNSAVREGMLVEGPQGWGEFSPDPGGGAELAARWLTAAVEGGTVGWPDPLRGRVPIAVTVPAVGPARAHQIAAASGCRSADVVVAGLGGTLDDDIARVEAVRAALGADGAIRCDAGGRWSVDAAVSAIAAIADAAGGLEYVSQPCGTLDEMAAVRRAVDVRIAVDPSIERGSLPRVTSLRDVADVAVLRAGPLGGVRRALRLAEMSGLPCVVSSSFETSIGLASGLALAGSLPDLPFACALGTIGWLAGDVVTEGRSLVPSRGYLPVSPSAASPEPLLVQRYALTDQERVRWWRARLGAVRSTR